MLTIETKEDLMAAAVEVQQAWQVHFDSTEIVKKELEEKRNALNQLQEELNQRFEALRVREAKICSCQK